MATTAHSPEYTATYRFWCYSADLPEIQRIVARFGLRFVNNPPMRAAERLCKTERVFVMVGGDRIHHYRAAQEEIRAVVERSNATPAQPKGILRRMTDELYRRGWLA